MKQILLALLLGLSLSALAQTKAPISIRSYAEYGYNYTWENYGGLAVIANIPINSYFSLEGGINTNTSNVHAINTRAIVHFPLAVGDLTLENRYLYRLFLRTNTNDLAAALSVGYSINHFKVGLGVFARLYGDIRFSKHTESIPNVIEPFNLIYNIEGQLFKADHNWNLALSVSNHDDFQIERMYQPIFTLKGNYMPAKHFNLLAEVACKPAGMFHGAADFYAIYTRLGFSYIW